MNYYANYFGSNSSLLEPIKSEKNVKLENIPMPFKLKKIVKWENMPIREDMKYYNFNPTEQLNEIIERMEKNPEITQVIPTKEYIVGNICNNKTKVYSCMRPDIMDIRRTDMKERIKIISEKFKN